MTYESYVGLENISVNNTKNIPLPTSLPEERHHKDIESCTVWFLTLRLLVYQMIVTLFRFWVLIIFWAGLRGHPFSTYAKFFEKKKHFLTLKRTSTCAYQGVRNVSFFEKFCVCTKWMTPNQYVYSSGIIRFEAAKITGIKKSSGKLFCHVRFEERGYK